MPCHRHDALERQDVSLCAETAQLHSRASPLMLTRLGVALLWRVTLRLRVLFAVARVLGIRVRAWPRLRSAGVVRRLLRPRWRREATSLCRETDKMSRTELCVNGAQVASPGLVAAALIRYTQEYRTCMTLHVLLSKGTSIPHNMLFRVQRHKWRSQHKRTHHALRAGQGLSLPPLLAFARCV